MAEHVMDALQLPGFVPLAWPPACGPDRHQPPGASEHGHGSQLHPCMHAGLTTAAHTLTAKGLAYTLVAHAHAKEREERPQLPDRLQRDARVRGLACAHACTGAAGGCCSRYAPSCRGAGPASCGAWHDTHTLVMCMHASWRRKGVRCAGAVERWMCMRPMRPNARTWSR